MGLPKAVEEQEEQEEQEQELGILGVGLLVAADGRVLSFPSFYSQFYFDFSHRYSIQMQTKVTARQIQTASAHRHKIFRLPKVQRFPKVKKISNRFR